MKRTSWLVVFCIAMSTAALAQSDGQKSFDQMKSLAGEWQGTAKMDPPMEGMSGSAVYVVMRVTSRGNAIVHEMHEPGKPDDPAKNDHPVTMFYMDGDKLNLVHYCDAGNRPHMVAKAIDGKKLDFEFVDVTGKLDYGHMQHAEFTFGDANHHSEEWTFLMPGDKPMHAHMELKRVQ